MGQRGNMFANEENIVKNLTTEEITELTKALIVEILNVIGGREASGQLGILALGAKIGTSGHFGLNYEEKELLNETLVVLTGGTASQEEIYNMVEPEADENAYALLEKLLLLAGAEFNMALLRYILCFAYIDGELDDDIAERLESIFGLSLMADFFMNGGESVPVQKKRVHLSTLEIKLVKYFKKEDAFLKEKDICKIFSDETAKDIKNALASLCDKELFYAAETAVGVMYGLLGDEEFEFEEVKAKGKTSKSKTNETSSEREHKVRKSTNKSSGMKQSKQETQIEEKVVDSTDKENVEESKENQPKAERILNLTREHKAILYCLKDGCEVKQSELTRTTSIPAADLVDRIYDMKEFIEQRKEGRSVYYKYIGDSIILEKVVKERLESVQQRILEILEKKKNLTEDELRATLKINSQDFDFFIKQLLSLRQIGIYKNENQILYGPYKHTKNCELKLEEERISKQKRIEELKSSEMNLLKDICALIDEKTTLQTELNEKLFLMYSKRKERKDRIQEINKKILQHDLQVTQIRTRIKELLKNT